MVLLPPQLKNPRLPTVGGFALIGKTVNKSRGFEKFPFECFNATFVETETHGLSYIALAKELRLITHRLVLWEDYRHDCMKYHRDWKCISDRK